MLKPKQLLLLSLSLSLSLSLGILLLAFNPFVFADESITITTYYPSPYGSYNQLQANQLAVGDTNADSQMTSADLPPANGQIYAARSVIYKPQSSLPASNAVTGELVYKSSDSSYYYYNGSAWVKQGGGAPDYDSGWFAANNLTSYNVILTHNLGVFPSRIGLWFSPDNPPSSWIYPLNRLFQYETSWGWIGPNVRLSTSQVQLGFYGSGGYLAVWYDTVGGLWSLWNSGYLRVLLWK